MRIIISPAKKMRVDTDSLDWDGLPALIDRTDRVLAWLRSQSATDLRRLWAASEKIASLNIERLSNMDLRQGLTPALLSYDGIQYTYMAPTVFEAAQLAWVQEHLRILSAFYGVLKPLDGVTPYRLEMQAKAEIDGCKNLYEWWGDLIYRDVTRGDRTIVNLASKEYSRCVERNLHPDDTMVTCVFGELTGNRVMQRGVYAKMARGEMVRYLASIGATQPEQMRSFSWSGYRFDEGRSTATSYVFVRECQKGSRPV